IARAREDWMSGSGFGEVKGYDGGPLAAPELPPVPLKPRGRVR
ncbi:pirin family protein, partial [Streptomyces sp. NPDC056728]